jgi:hypothetical protein
MDDVAVALFDYVDTMKEYYNFPVQGAKFHVDEQVLINHLGKSFKGTITLIVPNEPEIEYWIKGYKWALWESELFKINKTCLCCRTEQPIENCTCQQCGSPEFVK